MSIKIFQFCFHVCVCVCMCLSTVISSIFGKSSHFPFPYFVLFVLRYFLSTWFMLVFLILSFFVLFEISWFLLYFFESSIFIHYRFGRPNIASPFPQFAILSKFLVGLHSYHSSVRAWLPAVLHPTKHSPTIICYSLLAILPLMCLNWTKLFCWLS